VPAPTSSIPFGFQTGLQHHRAWSAVTITDAVRFFGPLSRSYRKRPPDTTVGEKDSPIVRSRDGFLGASSVNFGPTKLIPAASGGTILLSPGLQGYHPASKANKLQWER